MSYTKAKPKCLIDTNGKHKTIKLLEENLGKKYLWPQVKQRIF